MIAALIAIETISVFLMLTRWSKKYAGNEYSYGDDGPAFFGNLAMGLIPIAALAYMLGQHLHSREIKMAARAKELAEAEKNMDKLLGE